MPVYEFSDRVNFSAQQMFDMVGDVGSYHVFLPLCSKSEVFDLAVDVDGIKRFKANLLVERQSLNISETFLSDVVVNPNRMTVVSKSNSGPIKYLTNSWQFVEAKDGGCHTKAVLDFEMSSLPLRLLMKASFDIVMKKLTASFEQRAQQLYGNK